MIPPIRATPAWPRFCKQPLLRGLAALVLATVAAASPAQAPTAAAKGNSGTLPSLGDGSDLPAAAERRIGDRIAVSIYRDPDYVDDPVLTDYVQTIWQPLLTAARARGELSAELDERFAWQLFLIRDRTINAFALPGGYFGVHLGLISTVASGDELAAVLAHELSHVTQRHISRLMTQQSKQAPWMIAAMVLGALASSKNPNAGAAAIVGGQAIAAQGQLNFSRDMEREADRVGFGVMQDAGYASGGVTGMFEKLQQANRLNDNGSFPYLRSHPLTTERIAEAQARVQLVPNKAPLADSARQQRLHALMAARARVLAVPGVDVLRTLVAEAQRRTGPAAGLPTVASTSADPSGAALVVLPALPALPARPASASAVAFPSPQLSAIREAGTVYAGAFAAAQLRDFTVARSLLGRLRSMVADDPRASKAAELLAIEIELLDGKTPANAATADIGKAATRAELLLQARSLTQAGRAPEVAQALQTWVAVHPRDALAWQLLAVAHGQQGQTVRAIRADAESRAAQLDYGGALDRLKAAQAAMRSNPGNADHVDGSIIDTRTRQVESILKEQALQDKVDR